MLITIYGSGCPKCKKLTEHAQAAVKLSGVKAEVQKETSLEKMLDMGIMSTPALAIDGKVVSAGRLLSPEQIADIIKGSNK